MAGSRALPDLISRIRVDSSGVDQALTDLTKGLGRANFAVIAAGAAVGGVIAGVEMAVQSYVKLGDEVLNYQRVTGESAQESSRQVETFQILGVGADTASAAMFKFSKAIETAPKKLTDLGVVIAKTSTGTIDLSQSLFNLSDAYNATADPAKKNLILFDAFGRAGKDMIPILEQGSAALKAYEASAGMVFTQDDLKRLKEYQISVAQTSQSFQEFVASQGQQIIPFFQQILDTQSRGTYVMDGMQKALHDGTITYLDNAEAQLGMSNAASYLSLKLGLEWDAQHKAKDAAIAAALAIQDQTAANDLLTKSFDDLLKSQDAELSGEDKLVSESAKVRESQDKINAAIKAEAAARKQFGANSPEARAANDAVRQAIQDQKDAYIGLAKAQLDLFITQETANGGTRDSTAEHKVLIKKLQDEADALSPKSPLRKNLQAYIDTLKNDIPAAITTKIYADYQQTGKGPKASAAGGRQDVGVPTWVGELGPEIFVPDRPGTIIPHGASMAAAAAPSAGTTTIVNVNNPRADAWEIANEIHWQAKTRRLG